MGVSDIKYAIRGCENHTGVNDIFAELFKKNYAALFFFASRFLDPQQAEDVVQDAFADLWERRNSIDMNGNIRAFMYRSVYTRSLNRLKHNTTVNNYSQAQIAIFNKKAEYMSPDNNEITKKLEDTEIGTEIEGAIETLPQKCREVFRLSYLYDMKNAQIAQALGISLRTVEAHMYKALKYLRDRLSHLQ